MLIWSFIYDSFLALRSRALFWLTLSISMIVAIGFASISFTENGISLLYGLWEIENEYIQEGSVIARALYIGIFTDFIVTLWLAWFATLLAIISTSGIFPDFISGGTIDVIVSKPSKRISIFLSKYISSLLFVFIQVAIFCIGIFITVWIRIDYWMPELFLTIPVVVLFYSYLYSINVLAGTITKSSLTALLITLVFWASLYTLETAEKQLTFHLERQSFQINNLESAIERVELKIEKYKEEVKPNELKEDYRYINATGRLEDRKIKVAQILEDKNELLKWHNPIHFALTILPKTKATIGLVSKWLADESGYDMRAIFNGDYREIQEDQQMQDLNDEEMVFDYETGEKRKLSEEEKERKMIHNGTWKKASKSTDEKMKERPLWWVLGTSILFEIAVLLFAGWRFSRRDF